jgi:hypothetical protein
MKKILALLAAIIIASGVLGGVFSTYKPIPSQTNASAETADTDPVLAVFNGTEIHKSEVKAMIDNMVSYGSLEDETDYRTAVEFMVNSGILQAKIKEMGFDVFTADELSAFSNDADAQWNKALEDYVTYYLTEDTEEARATLRTAAQEYYAANNYSRDVLLANLKNSAAYDRMNDYMLAGYVPTEDEILAVFNQYGAQYQANYEGNVPMYEYMTSYNGSESWYVPEGYRGIIHILLTVDEALLTEYTNLQAAYEESASAEDQQTEAANPAATEAAADPGATAAPVVDPSAAATPAVDPGATEAPPEATAVPVTIEQVDAARAAVLASKQDVIDQIYARLATGETFQSLIAEFGTDPGMQDADKLANGYPVHKESILYDPVFTAAAFSEKMVKIGDVSDPVVGQYGIHILYYLRDVPGGLIMTDAIHKQIYDYLNSKKSNEAYNQALAEWITGFTVVYNDDAIAAATQEAAAAAAAAADAAATATPAAVPEATAVPDATAAAEATVTPAATGN